MFQVGFIGYGSMGSMLVRAVLESGVVNQDQIIVTRKNKSRLHEITMDWPNISTTEDIQEIGRQAKYIFICVKPMEYVELIKGMKPFLRQDQHIVSIAASVMMENLEKIIPCKITKLLPTVASRVNEGITLIAHNERVNQTDAEVIETLLSKIGNLMATDEKNFDLASEFTSCGPGFIAAVFYEFLQAGLRYTDCFTKDQMEEMLIQTLYGTTRVILENQMGFQDVISKVSTKGGITEVGVNVIHEGMPQVFDEILKRSMEKREVINGQMSKVFDQF